MADQPRNPRQQRSAPSPAPHWTVFVYMCGDNFLDRPSEEFPEGYISADFQELCRAGSSDDLQVVVQVDRREGTKRYVLGPGNEDGTAESVEDFPHVEANTGDPQTLISFLKWGLENCRSERIALVISGLGMSPQYSLSNLPPEDLPQQLREHADQLAEGKSTRKQRREWIENLPYADRNALRERVHRRMFSICHDVGNRGSLDICELRAALYEAVAVRESDVLDPIFDLVAFDVGASALVEVVYELEGLARVFVGATTWLPDKGLPYDDLLGEWRELAAQQATAAADEREYTGLGVAQTQAQEMAKSLITVAKEKSEAWMLGVNMEALDAVALALDSLALGLLHSLGDWHVVDALRETLSATKWKERLGEPKDRNELMGQGPSEFEDLPLVDLLELLSNMENTFRTRLNETEHPQRTIPKSFGQFKRVRSLHELVRKTLAVLLAKDPQLVFAGGKETGKGLRGLAIVMPPGRTLEQVNEEKGPMFNLSQSNYITLNFSERVHWASLVGTFQLIHEKPHALWRVINSMLADASGPARDAALSRLMSPSSVIPDLRGQFRSLGNARAWTFSLESKQEGVAEGGNLEVREFLTRLESSLGGGTVRQQECQLSSASLGRTLRELNRLFTSRESAATLAQDLKMLGQPLGADLIRNLAEELEDIVGAGDGQSPHLTLQMPRELMQYPWELMHDRAGLLSQRFAIGRQVFMDWQYARPVAQRRNDGIRVLVIGDPKFDEKWLQDAAEQKKWHLQQLSSARNEARLVGEMLENLKQELAGLTNLKVTEKVGERVTCTEVRHWLDCGEYDIIHYAGHAYFDDRNPFLSSWVLSDGMLSAGEIRNTLNWSTSPPWLVFANACEAGMDRSSDNTGSKKQRVGDVSGLATAFVNQGVAAYIAPMWPVDDHMAFHLAASFYHQLLVERFSIGESLRRARLYVRNELEDIGLDSVSMSTAMTWASFVLYGDPTAQLLQSLWTPSCGRDTKNAKEASSIGCDRPASAASSSARSLRSLSPKSAQRLVTLADAVEFPADERSVDGERSVSEPVFELLESNGLRYWQIRRNGEVEPVSSLGSECRDPQSKLRLSLQPDTRGALDYARILGRWLIDTVSGAPRPKLVHQLVEQYDEDTVPVQQLFRLHSDGRRTTLDGDDSAREIPTPLPGQDNRVLLYIHGTFSRCEPTFDEWGQKLDTDVGDESFLNWAHRTYRAVLGFDHWTLSLDPEQNAQLLWDSLPAELRRSSRLDIVTHSRGGLVARAFVELLGKDRPVRKVIFAATPNAGTSLANPENIGAAADFLVNVAVEDKTGVLGRLSGFLVHMFALGKFQDAPGLLAQCPDVKENDFLKRLQRRNDALQEKYAAISVNYRPLRSSVNLVSLLTEGGDQLVDKFFQQRNDLVVDTEHVWSIDGKVSPTRSILSPGRLLVIDPEAGKLPKGAKLSKDGGVHHLNLFMNPSVREFLREQLQSP